MNGLGGTGKYLRCKSPSRNNCPSHMDFQYVFLFMKIGTSYKLKCFMTYATFQLYSCAVPYFKDIKSTSEVFMKIQVHSILQFMFSLVHPCIIFQIYLHILSIRVPFFALARRFCLQNINLSAYDLPLSCRQHAPWVSREPLKELIAVLNEIALLLVRQMKRRSKTFSQRKLSVIFFGAV